MSSGSRTSSKSFERAQALLINRKYSLFCPMPEQGEQLPLRAIEEGKAALAKARGKDKGPFYVKMADAYKALKQSNKALVCYQEAYETGYLEPAYIERFATDLADSGKGEQALVMLKRVIDGTQDPLALARLYTKAGTVSRLIDRYDSGIKMAKKALEVTSKLPGESPEVKRVKAEAQTAIGLILWRTGDYSEAQKVFEKALEEYSALDDKKGMADVYNHLGIMFSVCGEQKKALDHFERSRKILDKARIYINVGLVKVHMGDFKGAEEDLRTAIKKGHEEGYKFSVHLAQMDLAELFIDQENKAKARTWIDLAYKGFSEMDQDPRRAMVFETTARVQLLEGDIKGARKNLEKAYEIARASKAKELESWCHYVDGLILIAEGDLAKAKQELEGTLDMLKKINLVRLMGRVYMVLADVNRKLGKDAEAKTAAAEARKYLEKLGSKHLLTRMKEQGF
jgi:tetratricopeptide (TPR) repeat protein